MNMNENAFTKIAPRLRQRALKASRQKGATETEAEDIAQDVMLRLWQMHDELNKFRSVEAVAVQMAHNLTLNELRKKHRQWVKSKETEQIADEGLLPTDSLELQEMVVWLEQRIKELPETEHTILYMRQVEKRTNEEIARLLDISVASVSTLLARARRHLLEKIKRRNGK
ncbi:RNA polymerase sigma factor [Prevotella disiens]|uniref:RNA polymerase sigma factor n=1 Tax=Prevotella disiens TaxID=28130 RepID=UPI00336AD828